MTYHSLGYRITISFPLYGLGIKTARKVQGTCPELSYFRCISILFQDPGSCGIIEIQVSLDIFIWMEYDKDSQET
nr:MAG TPA: hypothetical protein [Inoviridae sp.]